MVLEIWLIVGRISILIHQCIRMGYVWGLDGVRSGYTIDLPVQCPWVVTRK